MADYRPLKKHIKRIGRNYDESELKTVTGKDGKELPSKVRKFMASKKNMVLYNEKPEAIYGIYFVNHEYMTSDKEEIDFIEEHPSMGQDVFKDKFPQWLVDKFQADKEWIKREDDYFDRPS